MKITASSPVAWRQNGYAVPYYMGEVNRCPGCGQQQWIIGRLMAECAFCGMALSLGHVHGYGAVQRYSTSGEKFPTVA